MKTNTTVIKGYPCFRVEKSNIFFGAEVGVNRYGQHVLQQSVRERDELTIRILFTYRENSSLTRRRNYTFKGSWCACTKLFVAAAQKAVLYKCKRLLIEKNAKNYLRMSSTRGGRKSNFRCENRDLTLFSSSWSASCMKSKSLSLFSSFGYPMLKVPPVVDVNRSSLSLHAFLLTILETVTAESLLTKATFLTDHFRRIV